jgi:RepB DNA-primase N-terminal domain/RepB DNA-primase C-terminal helical domain
MSGIGANSPVAKYPVSASGRLEGFPVEGAFARAAVPGLARQAAAADCGLGLSMWAIRRQLSAMPCHLYQIRLVHQASRQALPGQRLWRAPQLAAVATVRFLRARNREGYDVYFRPYAGDGSAGYILVDLDGRPSSVLDCMCTQGHEPCLVVETSPGHLQAWIRVSTRALPARVATGIAQHLAHLYGADRGSAEGRHLGRLAGFTNRKPQRRLPNGLAPWVRVRQSAGVLASQGSALVEGVRLPALREPVAGPRPAAAPGWPPAGGARPSIETVEDAATIYQAWLHRLGILQRFPQPDWSVADLWIAKELLRQRTPPDAVAAVLRRASPQFPRRHANPEDYLRRTLARAAAELGCGPFPGACAEPPEGCGFPAAPGALRPSPAALCGQPAAHRKGGITDLTSSNSNQ